MTLWWPIIAALALGYLLGSIPFGLLLTRAAGLGDIRKVGSGNIGATNVLRTGNKGLAALTLLLDALKGTAAVLIARALGNLYLLHDTGHHFPGPPQFFFLFPMAAAGLGAFLGHIFPVWLGFKGGKGVATYIGVLLGLAWKLAIVFCGIWLLVALVTRYSSLSALMASVAVPIVAMLMGTYEVAILIAILSVLLIWKHSANISRLMAGTEPRIGAKEKA